MADEKVTSSSFEGGAGGVGLPILASLASQAAGGFINSQLSKKATQYQTEQQKELMRYQWQNFLSPSAQVGNFAKAGLNPAAMFTNGNAMTSGPNAPSVTAPTFGIGTTSMSDLAAIIMATAQAKKAGADTKNVEADTDIKLIQKDRDELELKYRKLFGSKSLALEVANAYQALRLAQQQEDTVKIEQEEKRWKSVTQKILSELSGYQRDIAAKELANKDKELGLRNKLLEEQGKTERSKQSANYAGAEASKAAASNYHEQAETTKSLRPHQIDAAQLENGLKAVDFDVKSATSDLSKQEFIERVLNLMSQNRTGKAWTAMFGTSEVSPRDVELGSMYKAANALWEKYKQGVQQGIDKVNSHKNKK